MRRTIAFLTALFLLLTASAAGAEGADEPLSVVATDFPCYDLARQVLGDDAGLTLLIRQQTAATNFAPRCSAGISCIFSSSLSLLASSSPWWPQ